MTDPMHCKLDFPADHAKPAAKVSVILLDWNVRESFHGLHYLNRQTVDRSRYELIWINFYDAVPPAMLAAVRAGEAAGTPIVDKWVVMNYPKEFIFNKHRMYNLGIVLAEGDICVICDSDAMFRPTFIEKIIAAFEQEPNSAVHIDEVRSASRDHYPFNYPSFEEVLAGPCQNWCGHTTLGLNECPDMLHQANYGACLAARRSDLIRIGGSDEHLDYLGYICGPYDLTFRLANAGCKERWLRDEFLFHTWHPGESGVNTDYIGPSDGRGMSSRALEVRQSGKIAPALENSGIRALRLAPEIDRRAALELLAVESDEEWKESRRMSAADAVPRLVVKAFRGTYDIHYFRKCWYAIPTGDQPFDPAGLKEGKHRPWHRTNTREELEAMLAAPRRNWFSRLSRRLVRSVNNLVMAATGGRGQAKH